MEDMRKAFLIILINLASVHCMPKCCYAENNTASSAFVCSNGAPLNMASCGFRFFVEEKEESLVITIDEDDNLVLDGTRLAVANEYCFTKIEPDDDNVFVVCMTDELEKLNPKLEVKMCLNMILQLVSVIFIFLTVVVYLILPQMLDLQGISIVHSITGLALGYIMMVAINLSNQLQPFICHFLAYCVYISFLYAFFWLNIICFHIWRQTVKLSVFSSVKRWSLIYHLYGILGPLLCTMIVLVIHYADIPYMESIHPGIGDVSCWFKSPRETFIYFYMPVIILISMNVVFFIWTSIVLWKQSKNCRKNKVMKFRVRMYVKLFFVMGVSWIFEVLQTLTDTDGPFRWLWYILDAVNASEGLIIFLILVVFRKRVVRSLANKAIFDRIRLPASWKYAEDSECEELEIEDEELNSLDQDFDKLDGTTFQRVGINQ